MSEKKKYLANELRTYNEHAAGIDVSKKDFYVAAPSGNTIEVRVFKSFTRDIHSLVEWLVSLGVETVAMESTGVYWIQLYRVLQDYGIEPVVVNARHVQSLNAEKTDAKDCKMLQHLHSCGILKASYYPDNEIRALRSYMRQREVLVRDLTRSVQHMQKNMDQMNIKLNNVLSDINSRSGIRIIESILAGQRQAEKLASLADRRVKCSKEDLIKSLEGDWRREHLYGLKQAYDRYKHIQEHIKDCDYELEKLLKEITTGQGT